MGSILCAYNFLIWRCTPLVTCLQQGSTHQGRASNIQDMRHAELLNDDRTSELHICHLHSPTSCTISICTCVGCTLVVRACSMIVMFSFALCLTFCHLLPSQPPAATGPSLCAWPGPRCHPIPYLSPTPVWRPLCLAAQSPYQRRVLYHVWHHLCRGAVPDAPCRPAQQQKHLHPGLCAGESDKAVQPGSTAKRYCLLHH